jgi:transcriptional regulator with XRE-family HTH domain
MKDSIYVEAGKRIRMIREKNHYTRDYVAMRSGISAKFLYEIEHGVKGFSADNLYKISKALDVSSEYILCGHTFYYHDKEMVEVLSLFTADQLKEITIMLRSLYNSFNK